MFRERERLILVTVVAEREIETDRQTDRQTETKTEIQRQRDTHRDRERDTETHTERQCFMCVFLFLSDGVERLRVVTSA